MTRPAATIRVARIDDLDTLVELENSVFPGDRLSRRSLRYYIGSSTAVFLALDVDHRLAGDAIVAFRRGSTIARLYSLAIRADLSGRGFGRQLLAASEAGARARGCTAMRLEVREDNPAAIGLYESAGYARFGQHADYYDDGAAAVRFAKDLTSPR